MNEELINLLNQVKDQWGRGTVAAILRKIDDEGLVWNGTLRRSVIYEQQKTPDGDISFFMADYGKYLDKGVNGIRSAYTTPFNYTGTPENIRKMGWAIKPWADSKGLNSWAVAASMQKKGVRPRRFFDSVVESRVSVLGEMITAGISEYMTARLNGQ